MSDNPTHRNRLGAVAGLLGAATAFTLILGAGPAPSVFQLAGANEDVSGNCDEAEHANDPECAGSTVTVDDSATSSTVADRGTSTTVGGSTPTTAPAGLTSIRSIDAAGAGTVLVAVDGASLRIVAATPTPGWRVEVEQASGREVEVDFRAGTKRVQVNVELEDGQVRERVRVRDDADGTDVRSENGTIVRGDDSGHGSDDTVEDTSGHGSDDGTDDHGGSGHGSDDASDDDSGGSGHGGDDASDDNSGGSGHGSDD